MKKILNLFPLLIAALVLTLNITACNSLETDGNYIALPSTNAGNASQMDIDKLVDDGTDPDENIIPFKLTPADGWEVHPGETIMIQAWFWDETRLAYVEVTHSQECRFDSSQFGKSVNGNDPALSNGQEICVSAEYNGWAAQTTGRFVDSQN